jgi:negative regulator of sigma-B (phosphoserine phosphatase)
MGACLKKVKFEVIFEPFRGEMDCGDQYLVKELDDFTLVVVVDGLGHGSDAAFAAKKAIYTLEAHAKEPIETLFKLCNESLHDTRGAAMTIVKIDSDYKLTYAAIGNVLGVCWKMDSNCKLRRESIFMEGGIVGCRLPSVVVKEIAMGAGDTFILATDGIKSQFEIEPPKFDSPQKIAEQIFSAYRNKNDDGLVLVLQLL